MTVLLNKKATPLQIEQMKQQYGHYIKVVVDIKEEILAGGGEYHFDDEQELIKLGHKQANLWGGGLDLRTKEIDYNSMINRRVHSGNTSNVVESEEIRQKMAKIIKELML